MDDILEEMTLMRQLSKCFATPVATNICSWLIASAMLLLQLGNIETKRCIENNVNIIVFEKLILSSGACNSAAPCSTY